MKLYWGDLHNHCGITYGYGGLEHALEAARKQLDFCSVTPHAMWPDIPPESPESSYLRSYHLAGFEKIKKNWEQVKQTMERANKDGEFVTFHSFEMHSSQYGDHHILSPDVGLQLLYEDTPHQAARKQTCRAIAIPHHIAYTPGYRGINWSFFDSSISPVVEVYSKHGLGLKDDGNFPYLHTMGPRDSRTTAYAGLEAGNKFSFVASTDHHAGFPGSYGDGKLAVLAEHKTRSDLWDAILRGRTYAVTGDKIQCEFSVNDMPFGTQARCGGPRAIRYRVEGGDALDKIVVYRNLKPLYIVNGETLHPVQPCNRYKVRLELGWGSNRAPYLWNTSVKAQDGVIVSVEPCIRGRSILSPTPEQREDMNINQLTAEIRQVSKQQADFICQTFMNPSPSSAHTSGMILEIEGDLYTRLDFSVNGRRVQTTIGELTKGSLTGQMLDFASEAYRICRAVPYAQYETEGALVDEGETAEDFYHMEVRQKNGCEAYISPVFLE